MRVGIGFARLREKDRQVNSWRAKLSLGFLRRRLGLLVSYLGLRLPLIADSRLKALRSCG